MALIEIAPHHFGEVQHGSVVFEDTLGRDKSSLQGSAFPPGFLFHSLQLPLQVGHVVVFIPLDCASSDLETLLDGKVDRFVCYYDVPSFGESGNDRSDRREGLRVDDDRVDA